MTDTLKRFKTIAFVEGISFITLLFIAMPLKYIAGFPIAVKIVGMTHGILFLLYLYFQMESSSEQKWSLKFNAYAFLASVIPFGTFFLEKKLKQMYSN